MKNKKKLGAAFIALAFSGFAGLMVVAPGALATDAGVSSSVVTEELCEWQIFAVPADFAVSSGGAEYVGEILPLTAVAQTVNVYVTGNEQATPSAADNTACAFYTEVDPGFKTRPTVVMSVGTGEFAATYPGVDDAVTEDGGMSFTLNDSPLKITSTLPASCIEDNWAATNLSLGVSGSGVNMEIPLIANIDNVQAENGGQRCTNSFVASIDIPGDVMPLGPGKTYSYSGITLTTTLTPVG